MALYEYFLEFSNHLRKRCKKTFSFYKLILKLRLSICEIF